jgi:hypothetical protein
MEEARPRGSFGQSTYSAFIKPFVATGWLDLIDFSRRQNYGGESSRSKSVAIYLTPTV